MGEAIQTMDEVKGAPCRLPPQSPPAVKGRGLPGAIQSAYKFPINAYILLRTIMCRMTRSMKYSYEYSTGLERRS